MNGISAPLTWCSSVSSCQKPLRFLFYRDSKNRAHSQWAGPDLPAVLLAVIAGQAVSRGSTLTAAVATAAAVTVGRGGYTLLQLGNCGVDYTVPLVAYESKDRRYWSAICLHRHMMWNNHPKLNIRTWILVSPPSLPRGGNMFDFFHKWPVLYWYFFLLKLNPLAADAHKQIKASLTKDNLKLRGPAHLCGNVSVCGRVWGASRCRRELCSRRFSSWLGGAACWWSRGRSSECLQISAQTRPI